MKKFYVVEFLNLYRKLAKTRLMDKNDIINYVMHTPHNTNKAVLSDMLNQLTEGGSGGSSDFSTAEVTVTGGDSALELPTCASGMGMEGIILSTLGAGSSATVPLWKGHLYCVNASVATVSGDAELIYGGGAVDIYGDCTITIS